MKKSVVPQMVSFVALTALAVLGSEFDDYALKVVEESKDVDAFENGSFEDGAKRGPIDKYREIGSFGVNGGGGLRIRPNNGKIYHGLKLNENRLIKGNRYVFSADVKMVGNVGGVIALDTFFKGTNKTAPGCSAWGTCSEKRDNGWVHQSVELVAKHDQEKLDYKFIVYGRVGREDPTNPVNCVCVDNLRIDLVAPKWYLGNTWPAYNLIHKDEGRIRFNSTFWGNFLEADSEAVYGCRLLSSDGRELGRSYVRPDANGNFTADFGKLAYEGPAKVAVTLYDRTHRLNRGTREIDVTVKTPDRDKGLFATENGVVLKDGKPYLALGFYTNLAHPDKHDMKSVEHHMKLLSEAGFNVIMDYSAYMLHGARRDQFYALAAKYGIGVIDDSFSKDTDYAPGKAREATVRKIREIAAHPAHLGWYTMDEAPENAVPRLSGLRRLLNEEAPGKFVNTCNIMRAAPYLPTADAQGGDCYPVQKGSNGTLEEPNRRVKAVADCRPAAIWYAPQCYNWARMIPGHHEAKVYLEQGREPTFMEMLSVALVMAMNDTTGFLFYSHFELLENPVKEFREQRWNDMVKIAKEMRALEPYLMSGEKKEELAHADKKEAVRVQGLSDGKGRRCVLVAGLFHDHETTFTLPAEYGKLKSRFGYTTFADGKWTFKAKEFVCDVLEPDGGER